MSLAKIEDCQLTKELKELAATNLNENEDAGEKLQEMRNWLFTEGENCKCTIKNFEMSDFFILRFLRSCSFDVEAAKKKMTNFYTQRINMPQWYSLRDPFSSDVQALLELGVFFPLEECDNHGRTVMIIRACAHTPSIHQFASLWKTCVMVGDFAMRNHVPSTVHGINAIVDLKGVSMGHALQLTPHVLQQMVHTLQDCYPMQLKAFHFINPPLHVHVVLNVMKSFMKKTLRDRCHVHSKGKKLAFTDISDHVVPVEYGGSGTSLEDLKRHWKSTVEENKTWFSVNESHTDSWGNHIKTCLAKK